MTKMLAFLFPTASPKKKFFAYPTTNAGTQNGGSVEICTQGMHVFARFAPILHARSVLSNKICASELSRKIVKGALSVGYLCRTISFSFSLWFFFRVCVCPRETFGCVVGWVSSCLMTSVSNLGSDCTTQHTCGASACPLPPSSLSFFCARGKKKYQVSNCETRFCVAGG